jgi:hypothetical protein
MTGDFQPFGPVLQKLPSATALRKARAEGHVVSLYPGEMLFLPAYWLHRVESHNASISVNVWRESEDFYKGERLFKHPVPFKEADSADFVLASRRYLRALAVRVFCDQDARVCVECQRPAPCHGVMRDCGERINHELSRRAQQAFGSELVVNSEWWVGHNENAFSDTHPLLSSQGLRNTARPCRCWRRAARQSSRLCSA